MTPAKEDSSTALSRDVIHAFKDLSGSHPGFRPAHAKGILLSGTFTPSLEGAALTRAPHAQQSTTPITVRFSDFAGVPTIPDFDENASPRGIAIRFNLGAHVHTDITAHSVDAFPTRTAEEFVEFLRAIHSSGPGAPKPTPIEAFLATHPAALRFAMAPKPIPTSFAKESFFSVSAYKFTNRDGISKFGRYRIHPDGEGEYLDASAAAAKPPNFLFDDITQRLANGPVKLRIQVQLAEAGDVVDDSTVPWPEDRRIVDFGSVELTAVAAGNSEEQRHIIFDPLPRVDGIESSGDPLLAPRADVYLMSGRQRRTAVAASNAGAD